jgi:hypothetical protein
LHALCGKTAKLESKSTFLDSIDSPAKEPGCSGDGLAEYNSHSLRSLSIYFSISFRFFAAHVTQPAVKAKAKALIGGASGCCYTFVTVS